MGVRFLQSLQRKRNMEQCSAVVKVVSLVAFLSLSAIPINTEGTDGVGSGDDHLPPMSEEKRLCRSLMTNYTLIGVNGRPVMNTSEPNVVTFGLGLIQMDLDERNKILTTSMWSRYKWNDEYLRWDPNEFSGIKTIKLLSAAVWKPDIMLYNTAETDKAEREVLAVIAYDGTVLWVPHQIFRSSCSIDVVNFPFDYQVCSMYFGSWTYSITDLDLQLAFEAGIDLSTFMSDYKESCSWEIVNNTAERKALPEEDPTYVVLSFTLKMRRKMVFSTYILTLPCVFLASLTLVVFWLPPDRPDRTSLAMSIFASFLVLLLILVEAAPPTASSVPTLGIYYCFNMVIIMMSIFLSTLVVNICRCGDHRQRVPRWIRFLVVHCLSRILCVHEKVRIMTKGHGPMPMPDDRSEETHRLLGNHNSKHDAATLLANSRDLCENGSFMLHTEMTAMRNAMQDMACALACKLRNEESRRQIVLEWRSVALVLDRTFFYLYVIAIILSLLLLFPWPEY